MSKRASNLDYSLEGIQGQAAINFIGQLAIKQPIRAGAI